MESRRGFFKYSLAIVASMIASRRSGSDAYGESIAAPVILDTDIGDDIDDTWAMLMLLRMQQFDLKLVLGDHGKPIYRGRLLAKLLEVTGRTDVPVGIGLGPEGKSGRQSDWLGDYSLVDYPGTVHQDGIQALIDTIRESPEPITLICIGPVPNIAEALKRDPSIADNARFVGMHGSIYVGFYGKPEPAAEWNVRMDPHSLQKVFAAPWDCTIAPLDTCGSVRLKGEHHRQIYRSNDSWMNALIENYEVWLPNARYMNPATDISEVSSTLYDTVAVYLAAEQDLVEMQDLPLRVTDDGYTVVDEANGRIVHCATSWKDLPAFKKKLVEILLG